MRLVAGISAADTHALAVEQYNRGTPVLALRTLRRALRQLASDPRLTEHDRDVLSARIWTSIALNESEVHSFDQSIAALSAAEQFATRADVPQIQVLLHCQRGLIEMRRGRLEAARASLDAAVGLIDHAQNRDQANILLNRGTVGLLDGQLRAARTDLENGVSVARRAGLAVEEFKTLHNLAYLEFLAGDLPRALRLMDAAADLEAEVSRGVWHLDRARVLVEAGLANEADGALARASEILARDRAGQDLAETQLERARCALALGDLPGARRLARSARARFRRRGNDRWRRATELVLLQADLAGGRPATHVAARAQALAAELTAEDVRLPARTAALIAAEAHLAAGHIPAAVAALDTTSHPRRDDPITGRMHAHYVRARVDAARGDRPAATRRIRYALDELARYQASFGSIDLRTASAVHGRRLAELDIELAGSAGRPAAIFAAAERARAVSSRVPAVRPPDDPATADLLAELRQLVESLRSVEQDGLGAEPLLRRRRDLERRIAARRWTIAGGGQLERPARLPDVRARLGTQQTMVMYVQAAGALCALVVGRRLRVVDLGPSAPIIEHTRRVRADLDLLAQLQLPAGIRAAVEASLRRSLAALDTALIAPTATDGPLVVVSTGLLGQLCWAALPSLRARPLVVAPSATKWLTSSASATRPVTKVVAIAGPGLARSETEVRLAGAQWAHAQVLVGAQASTAALSAALADANVVHVAAHGVHQPENPLFSSLRMVDGPLFAHELQGAARAPEHVILSACEVGLATVRPGDEALGLASVLLGMGTRSVVASVARVGDAAAEQAMAGYHARLVRGVDSATALAEALADSDEIVPFVNFGTAWTPEPAR